MTRAAFDLSEKMKLPVLMRLTNRMAHSRAVVTLAPPSRTQHIELFGRPFPVGFVAGQRPSSLHRSDRGSERVTATVGSLSL